MLEGRQEQLKATLSHHASEPAPLVHPSLAEVYRRKIQTLREALEEPTDCAEAFELIRSLIEAVVLVPTQTAFEIEVRGELAGILDLCQTGKKNKPGSISGTGLAEQLKVVAGTHNQRYLRLSEAWL